MSGPEHLTPSHVKNQTPSGTMTQELPTTDDAVEAVEVGRRVDIRHETPVNMVVRIHHPDGSVDTKNVAKNSRNVLLFKHGLYELVHGEGDTLHRLREDPYIAIAANEDDEGTYTLWVGDHPPVQTPPKMEEDVLRAVKELVEDEHASTRRIEELHVDILDNQVRRAVVNKLLDVPPFSTLVENGVLEATGRGWVFHDQLVLTWEGEFRNKDGDDVGYVVSGSGVRQTESANAAFELREDRDPEMSLDEFEDADDPLSRHTVDFGDGERTYGEQEFEFVTRAIWALKNLRLNDPTTDNDHS